MSEQKNPQPGPIRRRVVSLLTALTFLVMAVTGVLAFMLPFDIGIIGLHALMGFLFIALIALHVCNNSRQLSGYLRSKTLWATLSLTGALTALFWWQPAPVKTVLGWSGNLGPAMERFELRGYPKRGGDNEAGNPTWDLYYIDASFTTALDLIDSALPTIERGS